MRRNTHQYWQVFPAQPTKSERIRHKIADALAAIILIGFCALIISSAFGISKACAAQPETAQEFFLKYQAVDVVKPTSKPRARQVRQRSAPSAETYASEVSTGIKAIAASKSAELGLPRTLTFGLIRVESGWKPYVRGAAGEWGLTQIKCPTARGLGFSAPCHHLAHASTNLHWGLTHLAVAYRKCGTLHGAATLHNRGLGARCTASAYSRKVLS